MDIREKYKVQPTKEKKTMSKLQRNIHQLAQPYKKSKEYDIYGRGENMKTSDGETSVFWDSDVHHVDKYEGSDIIR